MGPLFRQCILLFLVLMVGGAVATVCVAGRGAFWFGSLIVIGPAAILWSRQVPPLAVGAGSAVLAAIATVVGASKSDGQVFSIVLTACVTFVGVGALSMRSPEPSR